MTSPVPRSLALVVGLFLLVNVVGGLVRPGLDTTGWVFELRWLPRGIAMVLMGVSACLLVAFAVVPKVGGWRRWGGAVALAGLAGVAVVDVVRVVMLQLRGRVQLGSPLVFSVLVLGVVVLIGVGYWRAPRARRVRWGVPLFGATAAACLVAFPFAQMLSFGLTDYRRPADAIVVFGARVYADGRLSDAVSDRMKTACELYHQGLSPRMILSGGPGDGPVHETEGMRRFALNAGVPDSALILDERGVNTRATIANAAVTSRERGLRRVMAVSHFFHLPRIKLQAERAGLLCYTVPAPQGHPLNRLPYFMAREAAACWLYVVRP